MCNLSTSTFFLETVCRVSQVPEDLRPVLGASPRVLGTGRPGGRKHIVDRWDGMADPENTVRFPEPDAKIPDDEDIVASLSEQSYLILF